MKCLVLGAAGFLGRHLVSELLAMEHTVIVYDRRFDATNSTLKSEKLKYITGEFSKEHRWTEILKDVQVCFHLISTTVPKSSNDDPIDDVQGNIIGTLNFLENAKKYKIRIVFTSSGGTVYGAVAQDSIDEKHETNPLCSYGITKLAIEKYLLLYQELHGLKSVVLRIANPYGEGQNPDAIQGAIGVFMARALRGHTIDIWGDGSVVRDYLYVSDVVKAMIAASSYGGSSHVFNIGSGIGVSLREILEKIEHIIGKKVDVVFHPPRGFDVPRNVLSISKAQTELGWQPKISMIEGLERTAVWMRERFLAGE